MNHTMMSMHERFDSFEKYHGENLTENEQRQHGICDNFKNDINSYVSRPFL